MLAPGNVIGGRYEIAELLGTGAMGAVYRGTDRTLGRAVAIKVVHDVIADDALLARFRREAQAMARVQHANVVQVLDWCANPGEPCAIVMELLDGESIRLRLDKRARFGVDEAARIAGEILGALATAHAAGVIHRDLKPANVLLARVRGGPDAVKILDFGLAKVVAATVLTETGSQVGSPAYMAPEVMRGDAADARSDLYGVGCILYEMLAGRRVFADKAGADLYVAIRHDAPAPVQGLRPEVPPALAAFVARMLAKKPEERFARAEDALTALRAAAAGVVSIPALPAQNPLASTLDNPGQDPRQGGGSGQGQDPAETAELKPPAGNPAATTQPAPSASAANSGTVRLHPSQNPFRTATPVRTTGPVHTSGMHSASSGARRKRRGRAKGPWIALVSFAIAAPIVTAALTAIAFRPNPLKRHDVRTLSIVSAASAAPPQGSVASASASAPGAHRPWCRCLEERNGKFFGALCMRPQEPVCRCGLLCPVPWKVVGGVYECPSGQAGFRGPDKVDGAPCKGFSVRTDLSGAPVNELANDKLDCSACANPDREVARGTHRQPCTGYDDKGDLRKGAWFCE